MPAASRRECAAICINRIALIEHGIDRRGAHDG